MNYLQYINQYRNPAVPSCFLVSGSDIKVRTAVAENILSAAHSRGLPLFILDNTDYLHNTDTLSGYKIHNVLAEGLKVDSVFQLNNPGVLSVFRSLLLDMGFDNMAAMKVISFFKFVERTEAMLGNNGPLTFSTIEEYGAEILIERKLDALVNNKIITRRNAEYLLGRYSEISSAAADFEYMSAMLIPFLESKNSPAPQKAMRLSLKGLPLNDSVMRSIYVKLFSESVNRTDNPAVIVFDDGSGSGCDNIDRFIKSLPLGCALHLFTEDVFTFEKNAVNNFLNRFNVKIYSRHNGFSAETIEKLCGDIQFTRKTRSLTVDHRLKNTSVFDLLFGLNKSETLTEDKEEHKPRYTKEEIERLPCGTAIIDFNGDKALFPF